jgi:uncharacterized membrane protein
MKKIVAQKLSQWEKAGLLQREQVAAILKFEEGLSENHWVLSGLMILGVLTIGIGVISLIAANWSEIPNAIKLTGNFLFLGVIGVAIFKAQSAGRETAYNAWIVAMQIAILASIGLISQIYHTGGELYQALLLWSLLLAPLAFAASKLFPTLLWTGVLLGAISWAVLDSSLYSTMFFKQVGPVFFSITMFSLLLAVISRLLYRGHDGPISQSSRFWAGIIGVGALILFEFMARDGGVDRPSELNIGHAFLVISLCGVFLGRIYNRFQILSLLVTLLMFSITAHLSQFGVRDEILHWMFRVGLTVLTLIAAGLFAASLRAQKTFQFILAAVGIRLLFVYFEALGGLAATGVGLILSGSFVMGMGWLWNKNRKRIQAWAEEFAQ